MGKKFMLYTTTSLPLIEDPYIVDYVRKLGHYIVEQVPSPPFDFHFYVINEEVYNAFAGPGGYIFIYTGLIAAMESEEELAGILGHEVAHVAARHISKRIEQAKKINIATMAGVLAGVFLGGGSAAGALSTTSLAAGQSLSLKYSRENEIEADQLGLKFLNQAGYGGPSDELMLSDIANAVKTPCVGEKLVIENKSSEGGKITYHVKLMQEGNDTPHYSGYLVYASGKDGYRAVEVKLKRGEGFQGGVGEVYSRVSGGGY